MKTLLIDAAGNSSWIGGLYYIKNVLFSLVSNEYILSNYKIIVVYDKENKVLFREFGNSCILVECHQRNKWFRRISILKTASSNHVSAIFPYWQKHFYSYFGIQEIYWFADYQECHFPEFYSKNDLKSRKNLISRVVKENRPIIFSSTDTQNDLEKNYGPSEYEYLMPFVSFIEEDVRCIKDEFKHGVLSKYKIAPKYICICNQFWQHKNHIVVFKALAELYRTRPEYDYEFVFTGKMEDYRNPKYIRSIEEIVEQFDLREHIKILGFIDRKEQLALMLGAEYIIQPSLFEGWGTVVEDAKVLDKTILLSDIPVHREQMNDKCILFDPYDPVALAKLIEVENTKTHIDDVEKGIANMYIRAKEYSKGFEKLLKDLERN